MKTSTTEDNTGYNRAPCTMQEVSKGCWDHLRSMEWTFQAEKSLPLKEKRYFQKLVLTWMITKIHGTKVLPLLLVKYVPAIWGTWKAQAVSFLKRWVKPAPSPPRRQSTCPKRMWLFPKTWSFSCPPWPVVRILQLKTHKAKQGIPPLPFLHQVTQESGGQRPSEIIQTIVLHTRRGLAVACTRSLRWYVRKPGLWSVI